MKTKTAELNAMLDGAVRMVSSNKREQVLKAVLWRFRGPNGEFVGLNGRAACAFVPEGKEQVFDGRDNPDIKLPFWELMLKAPLSIEILPQVK